MIFRLRTFFYFLLLLPLWACSPKGAVQRDVLLHELMKDGPVALSPDNPYVISNLFLGTEIQKSHILKGFVDYRGTPDAIQAAIDEEGRSVVISYYLERSEQYTMIPHEDTWIIKGPKAIEAQALSAMGNLQPSGSDAPMEIKYPGEVSQASHDPENEIPLPASDAQIDKPTPRAPLKEQKIIASKKTRPAPAVSKKPVSAKIENSPSGDIIHHISYPGETLRLVSLWYTGTADNSERLARINSFSDPDVLTMGQLVRIPRYMLKRRDPLPEVEVRKYYLEYSRTKKE